MSTCDTHPDPRAAALEQHQCQYPALKIASFNIQIFGDTKYEKEGVTDILLQILSQYDLVLIQEIRDKAKDISNDLAPDSFKNLVRDLNNFKDGDGTYDYSISERLGRGHSKEQYAYVYKREYLTITDTYQSKDFHSYERPPYVVRFSAPNCEVEDFAVLGIHVDPDEVPKEMEAMYDVYEEVVQKWGVENIILMGDFNAGGSYISTYELEQLRIRKNKEFQWLIKDYVDTTVKGTCYAYDRFIAIGDGLKHSVIPDSCHPFLYDKAFGLDREMAEDVSDHYPIEMMIYGKVKRELVNAFGASMRLSVDIKSADGADPDAVTTLAEGLDLEADADEEMVRAGWTADVSRTKVTLTVDDIANVVDNLQNFNAEYPGILSLEVIAGCESYMAAMKNTVVMPRVHGVTSPRSGLYDVTLQIDRKEPNLYRVCIAISE